MNQREIITVRRSGISLIQKEQIPSPKSLDSVESSSIHQSRKSILLFDIRLSPKLRHVCLVKHVVKLVHVFNSAVLALYAGMLYAINFCFYHFYFFLVGGTNIQFLFSTHTPWDTHPKLYQHYRSTSGHHQHHQQAHI